MMKCKERGLSMKKIIFSIIMMIIFVISSTQFVYAVPEEKTWVQDAFGDVQSFFGETVEDKTGIASPILNFFSNIIKGINMVLLVVLIGLSVISLSITGVRYIISGSSPGERRIAQENLKKAFKGMAIGFGAYVIWRVAMGFVNIIIGAFS